MIDVFEDAGWEYAVVGEEGQEVLAAGFEAHHTRVELTVQVFAELGAVSVVAPSTRTSPSHSHRERLAELAMRVNQTLTVGNFELDWDEGRLYFRTTNLFSDPDGDARILYSLVDNTIIEMDRIAPLESIILGTENKFLFRLDVPALLRRDDLLPEVPPPVEIERPLMP